MANPLPWYCFFGHGALRLDFLIAPDGKRFGTCVNRPILSEKKYKEFLGRRPGDETSTRAGEVRIDHGQHALSPFLHHTFYRTILGEERY